ncbi:hypothetical protein ACFL2Q_13135 [Thermodesulfobacteriota bacterium]
MLIAHLVPAYFAVSLSQGRRRPQWSAVQRAGLWIVALGSTVAPDLDVIYNILFRGFFGHSILLTHSVFLYLGIALVWWLIRRNGRRPYLQTMIGLVAVVGLSHLVLDIVAHSTPLFYPFSKYMIGAPSPRVMHGGIWGYLTDPVLLLEPLLIGLAVAHWAAYQPRPIERIKKMALVGVLSGLVLFSAAFLMMLPTLREIAGT